MGKIEEPTRIGTVVADSDGDIFVLADFGFDDCNWHLCGSGGSEWYEWSRIEEPRIMREGSQTE